MWIRNPVAHRELMGTLRRRRSALAMVLLAVLFSTLVVLKWPSDGRVDISGAQSREVFRLFGYGLVVSLLLLAPANPAVSIVRERRSGTLELLLNSPLTPWGIYWGKLFGALGFALLLLATSLPAAAAVYAMGGISLTADLCQLYGLLGLVALQYTALGLMVSSYARTSDGGLRITYACVLALAVLSLGPHLFFQGSPTLLGYYADWFRCQSPLTAVMAILGHGDIGSHGIISRTDAASSYVALAIATTVLFALLTMARLNHTQFDRARSAGRMTNDRLPLVRLFRRVFFLVDPQRRKGSIASWVNPVMVKEFRCRRFGRLHWMLRLAAVSALASLLLTYVTCQGTMDWGVSTIGAIMVLLQAALIVLVAPGLTAGLISDEVESGGWQLLQTTPLSAGSILRGKVSSVIWPILLILVSTLPGYLVMVYIEPDLWLQVRVVLTCLGLTALFAISLSLAASTLFSRVATAMTVSYVVLILLCGGTILVWLLRDAPFGYEPVRLALVMNPFASALQVIGTAGFTQYNLIPANWYFVGTATAALAVVSWLVTHLRMRPQ